MSRPHNPKILVIGTGAIGSFYGGKLAQAGASVSTLCRSDFEIVKSQGIRVKSSWGDFKFFPKKVICKVDEYEEKPDYLLVTLKALPTLNVPHLIANVAGPRTSIVLLQNGIDIESPFAKAFPQNEIISGLAFICVSRTSPGCVNHLDYGKLSIGNFPNGVSEKVKILCDLFKLSGVPCESSANIITQRWKKLMWNAPFNSISVLGGGLTTMEIMDSPLAAKLAKEIMKEVCEIGQLEGHNLSHLVIDQHLEHTRVMKPYKTSMLLDYEAGKPLETEAILGNAVRIAQKHCLTVPRLSCIYSLLKLIGLSSRPERKSQK